MKRFIALVLSLLICFEGSFSQDVIKTMLRLPDTGQNTSYTNTFGEDNDYTFFAPFFVQNNNGTVTDTITSLMWQKGDGGEMTIENALKYADTLTLGGYTDWRLPNPHEAFSILNHQNSNPSLDLNVFTSTGAEYWWTSVKQVNDSTKVWATNAGGGIGNHPKSETISAGGTKKFHARAVRETIPHSVLVSQYLDNGDGTITDLLTNLIWQKMPYSDTLSWEQALAYADTLTLAGASDWRLPNIKELQSINDETVINPSINKNFFSITAANKYWSSTTLPNQTTKAWYLNTQFGITTYDYKTLRHQLICVRTKQSVSSSVYAASKQSNRVFPNPFKTAIQLLNTTEVQSVSLYNAQGIIVYEGANIQEQNFESLPAGTYFLKINQPEVHLFQLIKE